MSTVRSVIPSLVNPNNNHRTHESAVMSLKYGQHWDTAYLPCMRTCSPIGGGGGVVLYSAFAKVYENNGLD